MCSLKITAARNYELILRLRVKDRPGDDLVPIVLIPHSYPTILWTYCGQRRQVIEICARLCLGLSVCYLVFLTGRFDLFFAVAVG